MSTSTTTKNNNNNNSSSSSSNNNNNNNKDKKSSNVVVDMTDENDNDDDMILDDDQLKEYREELETLGSFPDKVIINTLSMIAEDYADSITGNKESANKLYKIIQQRLLTTSNVDTVLPVIYVLDSILKNAKGYYINFVANDAKNWVPKIYNKLHNNKLQQQKLQKVWKTWNEFHIFDIETWKTMGQCFPTDNNCNTETKPANTSSGGGNSFQPVAGIPRTKDGTLILSKSLRNEMQNILDDMQSNITNELEKVSLERLADINPELLSNIKLAATTEAAAANSSSGGGGTTNQTTNKSKDNDNKTNRNNYTFLLETRNDSIIQKSKEWNDIILPETDSVIESLHDAVKCNTDIKQVYTQKDAVEMKGYLAVATATANVLQNVLQSYQKQKSEAEAAAAAALSASNKAKNNKTKKSTTMMASYIIDPADFTNDGIKTKNTSAIGILYDIGLPFISSADGKRFKTQIELSKHLDTLFQKNQIAKSIIATEERGYYIYDSVWTKDIQLEDLVSTIDNNAAANTTTVEGDDDNDLNEAVIADETRDRCVICGIHFQMFFNNDDGVYKYKNSREILVINDDAAAKESDNQLVHISCWKGLGKPDELTYDQTLEDTLRHS